VNSLCAFEDLSDDGTVAGIGKGRQPGVDAEVAEGCQYRVPVSVSLPVDCPSSWQGETPGPPPGRCWRGYVDQIAQ